MMGRWNLSVGQIRTAVLTLLLCGLVAASPSEAGTLTVSPTRVTLDAAGRAEVVKLKNPGQHASFVEVKVFAWVDAADHTALEPTQELLVVPPIFEIDPDTTQVIRLALRRPLDLDGERNYRLLIKEVPRQVGDGAQGLTFALQFSLPVFVKPDGAAADPAWSTRGDQIVLLNRGNAHIRLESLSLFAPDGAEPIFSTDQGGYLFGGEERSWPLELDTAQPNTPLTLKAETNLGPLETTVSWPEG